MVVTSPVRTSTRVSRSAGKLTSRGSRGMLRTSSSLASAGTFWENSIAWRSAPLVPSSSTSVFAQPASSKSAAPKCNSTLGIIREALMTCTSRFSRKDCSWSEPIQIPCGCRHEHSPLGDSRMARDGPSQCQVANALRHGNHLEPRGTHWARWHRGRRPLRIGANKLSCMGYVVQKHIEFMSRGRSIELGVCAHVNQTIGDARCPGTGTIHIVDPPDPVIVVAASIERIKAIEDDSASIRSDRSQVEPSARDVHAIIVYCAGPDEAGISMAVILKRQTRRRRKRPSWAL